MGMRTCAFLFVGISLIPRRPPLPHRHIAASGFVTDVLDPFLGAMLGCLQQQQPPDAEAYAAARVNIRTALRIICVATHKVRPFSRERRPSGRQGGFQRP